MKTTTDTVIIGGGLSGLYAAHLLEQQGHDYMLLEARDRFGGRIVSTSLSDESPARVDLGPSWFWPNINPQLSALIEALGITAYKQFSDGRYLVDKMRGAPPQAIDVGYDIMPDTYRLHGGMQAIINGLLEALPSEKRFLNTQVSAVLKQADDTYSVEYERNGDIGTLSAKHIVFAMPLRLVAKHIAFSPALDPALKKAFDSTETWMAAHAKAVLIYETPFWREMGFSGSVNSNVGPLVEIHDASPDINGEPAYGAIMGFMGINGPARKTAGDETLKKLIIQQSVRLFGPEAQTPLSVEYIDWYQDPLTATKEDIATSHGVYGLSTKDSAHPNIVFAGTEASRGYGGYLEGALDAASRAVSAIKNCC
ncbi:flavin monoamine oxidase family protein [Enterovibrio baiacu]|uniref:flavin monoamine oxidase family protein n=1 Tax=Enterovibrio baiacu TaxID=2491023 RepID=UPI0010115870|nr:FAD-dependent oxidoreductase [Enterovibrio baiacu]MBE1275267.1 FAD-binding protein [Enterovibrio baiacu]